MNWYTRWLIFIVTPIVLTLLIFSIFDSLTNNGDDYDIPIVITTQDK